MKRKILCVCSAANSRSVALAWELKGKEFNCDAICAGADYSQTETLNMLSQWADTIVLMQPQFSRAIPQIHMSKVIVCDVGPDIWVNPTDRKLRDIVLKWARENLALPERKT